MIRTFTPALAKALAAIRPAGPAPITRTSTVLSFASGTVMIGDIEGGERCRCTMRLGDRFYSREDAVWGLVWIGRLKGSSEYVQA